MTVPVITIDGPSGSGKGTIGILLAQRLGYHFLDSGALYRVVAVAAANAQVGAEQIDKLAQIAAGLKVNFDCGEVLLDGQNIDDQIRNEGTGDLASQIAVIPEVRQALLHRQRAFAQAPGLVADGRDMGTVVFPDADAKFFLTASAEERAQRRYNQLIDKGEGVSLRALVEEISARDERDSTREVSPLKPAADSVVIDSTSMTIDQVLENVFLEIENRLKKG